MEQASLVGLMPNVRVLIGRGCESDSHSFVEILLISKMTRRATRLLPDRGEH